jgi:Zn-dependent metalloprotease
MRAYVGVACVAWLACSFSAAFAAPAEVNPDDLVNLYNTLHAPNATETSRQFQTDEGFLRFVAAPPGSYFTTTVTGAKSSSASPEDTAQAFISANVGAFARSSSRMTFTTDRVKTGAEQSFVRLQQNYNGIKVFGGMMTVQTDAYGHVTCALSDVLRDTTSLDDGTVAITPSVSVSDAKNLALVWAKKTYGGAASDFSISDGVRMLYEPTVVGNSGSLALVWKFVVFHAAQPISKDVVFVDANSGTIAFYYPLVYDAKNRQIYDGQDTYTYNPAGPIFFDGDGILVRGEGQDECNITDANHAYDYFGDVYDFYYNVHGRDSIDGAGMAIIGTVRWCNPYYGCPVENAFWVSADSAQPEFGFSANHMYFGDGFSAADDVVGHELTHGVTAHECNLVYKNESGAINEGLSDLWGEWIDLSNGAGTDTAAVRWLCGEDLPGGAIRSMKNPPAYSCPDRMGSLYYYKGSNDNGGVHTNSGVLNKLAYLLTDGDTFNGYTIEGIGVEKAAKLFYELQTNLLTQASDYNDIYYSLGQATINLGYTTIERANVRKAALAVEIAPDTSDEMIGSFRAIPTTDKLGRSVIALTWDNPTSTQFKRVIIMRSTETYPTVLTDGVEIYRGTEEKYLDSAVVAGTQYYYTIFSQLTAGFPDQRFTRAIAGTTPADFLTEQFSGATTSSSKANPFDLSFTQLLFSPVGAPEATVGDSVSNGNYYSSYNLKVTKNIASLPVARQDGDGGAYTLDLGADQVWSPTTMIAPFPFFGVRYNSIYLSANGYIAFQDVEDTSEENITASPATHFAIPRISFLFSNLAPNIFGDIWARLLDDKVVITFESVPEMDTQTDPPSRNPNTVQIELFYSGHIRITYLDCSVADAVVGLSDGQGAPVDPATVFSGVSHVTTTSDLSAFSQKVSALTLEPIPLQKTASGDEVTFVAKTSVPSGSGVPALSAEWNGSGTSAPYSTTLPATQAPFADNGNGTGTFRWQTDLLDYGTYVVRVVATLGTETTYQDVTLAVGVTEPLPIASDVNIATNNALEDPSRDRAVDDDSQLLAQYNYSHVAEYLLPDLFGEGATQILWFKNNSLIPAFNNLTTVTPEATSPNDAWFYIVTPKTIASTDGPAIVGMPQRSPTVSILSLPVIYNVVLPDDIPSDATEGVALTEASIASGPTTGGTKVVLWGKRLVNPVSVTFGGIPVQSFTSIDQYRLEVVTPAHAASFVTSGAAIPEDVTVVTAAGPTTARESFIYESSATSILKADVNGDGVVDAVDVQIVVNAILEVSKSSNSSADVNLDGTVNAADLQVVISAAVGE